MRHHLKKPQDCSEHTTPTKGARGSAAGGGGGGRTPVAPSDAASHPRVCSPQSARSVCPGQVRAAGLTLHTAFCSRRGPKLKPRPRVRGTGPASSGSRISPGSALKRRVSRKSNRLHSPYPTGSAILQVQSRLLGYAPGNPGLRITPAMLASVPPQVAVEWTRAVSSAGHRCPVSHAHPWVRLSRPRAKRARVSRTCRRTKTVLAFSFVF